MSKNRSARQRLGGAVRGALILAVMAAAAITATPDAPAAVGGDYGQSNHGVGVQSALISTNQALALQAAGIGRPFNAAEVPPPGFPDDFEALKAEANNASAPQLLAAPTGGQSDPSAGVREIQPSAPKPLLGNFPGMGQTNFIPPDTTIAVGRDHILAAVNSRFTVYDRTGTNLLGPPGYIEATAFFAPLGVLSGLTLFDPWLVYDRRWKRYIQIWVARNTSTSTGYYVLAISPVGTPFGEWIAFALDATLDGGTPSSPRQWADYEKLGYDRKAIYITSNQFTFGGSFITSKIRRLTKADLLDGGGVSWTDWVGIKDSDGGTAFTLQPCQQPYGKFKGRMWFINTHFGTNNKIETRFYKNGTLRSPKAVTVATYSIPPDAKQKGDPRLINTNDNRLLNAFWVNGKIYGTHSTAANFGGGPSEAAIQWYILDDGVPKDAQAPPVVDQTGVFGATDKYYYFPSIVPNRRDGLGIAFTRSSSNRYASARRTGRTSTTAPNTLLGSRVMRGGNAGYFKDFGSGRNRWGDYSGSSMDLRSKRHVWLAAEYAVAPNTWDTWISRAKY